MSSDQKDPSWHASRLLMMALQAQQTADNLRNSGVEETTTDVPINLLHSPPVVPPQAPISLPPPTPIKWTSEKNPIPEESIVRDSFEGTKAPLQQIVPEEIVISGEIAPAKSKYSVTPVPVEIIIEGISFGDVPKHDTRQAPVIEVKHIDKTRDTKLGLPLSTYNLNYTPEKKDKRDYKLSFTSIKDLPKEFDLKSLAEWGSIYDQGSIGSCVSNSISASLRWIFMREGKGKFDPSRLFIYYNGRVIEGYEPTEDSGISIRGGFQSVSRYSVCGEQNWEYIENNFSVKPPQGCYDAAKTHKQFKFLGVAQNEKLIKKCVTDGYPISFGMIIYDSFMSTTVARTGKVPIPDIKNDQRCGGHCMTITGYSDVSRCFTVLNSWSGKWGDKGYCYIPYDYILDPQFTSDFWSPRSMF